MYVARSVLAILLETRPNNIKNIEQIENNIYIQLQDSEERLSIKIDEYKICWQQLKSSNHQINSQNLVIIAIIFGLFITATISSFNSNLLGDRTSPDNMELTADR